MTAVADDRRAGGAGSFDPITLEVLRSRLEAIAEDAAATVERTGVNPIITESHDFGVTLADADGNLVAGGGWVSLHWVASTRAVQATIAKFGDTIAPGDVFFANDPYNGGGLHANDVLVQRPIFIGDQRIAWMTISAHMLDFGGMAPGSFAPAATDCYQEALRIPPARLFERGVEVPTVWDIIRTNVRMAPLIEMDMRGLVAGAHVAQEKVAELVEVLGVDEFLEGVRVLQELSEREMRARIAAIADGEYRAVAWNEWEDELYRIPCTLTVEGDRMVFDFDGASPQAPHYFNSQPYIVKSALMMILRPFLALDLPYTGGLVAPIELRCPEGSIVNARPPAPINNGHVHVAMTAAEAALHCVRLAVWATHPAVPASKFVSAGGAPGVTAEFVIHRADGTDEHISGMSANVPVVAGDSFELRCPTAGGFGDPLERDPVSVADDAAEEWFSAEDARRVYGVVLDADGLADLAATAELRDAQRAERLARARAAVRPVHEDDIAGMADGETVPLTPGVVQRGSVAYAEVSGAPLAVAPDPWTDGCPVIEEPLAGPGPALVRRTYLDPRVGRALHVEVVPEGEGVNFSVQPTRWSAAG